MQSPACPACGTTIPSDDVNVASDVAFCRACNLSHKLSALTHGTALDLNVDLANPPDGAWCSDDGLAMVVGATMRSVPGALGALFFCLFWNGIVSVFVLIALASTLNHMGITLPQWFPSPRMSGGPMSLGMTLFLWIFLTPFIAVGLALLGAFLACLGGRVEITIRDTRGEVFSGIGPVGLRKHFECVDVRRVTIEDKAWRDSDGDRRRKVNILLEVPDKPIRFGSMLSDERRKFVAGVAAHMLLGADRAASRRDSRAA